MSDPTNLGPRTAPRAGHPVWALPGLPGYLESIQSAGSVAAPLLAGASFTLVALVLQSSAPFGRWQDLALLLFVVAGLAQVFAVQCVIWTRRSMVSPDELKEWFPEQFTGAQEQPTAWILHLQRTSDLSARQWATWTRWWVNAGISLLLAGVAVGVVPHGPIGLARWAVITVAWIGVAVEATWVASLLVPARSRRGLRQCAAAILTSGGATAAAGFAATAGTTWGTPATWWAVVLAVLAVPCWLASLTEAWFGYGRLRIPSPPAGRWAYTQAGLALLAPAVLALATCAAVRQVAAGRRESLCRQHPGVRERLPAGVGIRAHHRAWSQCLAMHVTRRDELAGLLDESRAQLGQDGQPGLDDLCARVERAPGCVVKVIDRGDYRTRFGYYIAYPLRAEAVRRIRSGQVTSGRQLEPDDLAVSAAVAGWYVPVIWAPGPERSRRCVIATLVDALTAGGGAGRPVQPVFAPPVTPQGQALLEAYRFAPVGREAGLWALPAPAAGPGAG